MQGSTPWVIGVAVAALLIAPILAYDPPYEAGITLTGRFVNADGQPVTGQVEVWQSWDIGRSGNVNHWNIPGWSIPTTRTDGGGPHCQDTKSKVSKLQSLLSDRDMRLWWIDMHRAPCPV